MVSVKTRFVLQFLMQFFWFSHLTGLPQSAVRLREDLKAIARKKCDVEVGEFAKCEKQVCGERRLIISSTIYAIVLLLIS